MYSSHVVAMSHQVSRITILQTDLNLEQSSLSRAGDKKLADCNETRADCLQNSETRISGDIIRIAKKEKTLLFDYLVLLRCQFNNFRAP